MSWQFRRGFISGRGAIDAPASHASTFLARTSGLDATHITAYTDLINGLDTDGLFSKLDVLHIYATQDSTTALLNVVSTSYSATLSSSPTFTADRGFSSGASGTVSTGFNPSSAGSPNFVQNSAHISAWSVTDPGTSSIIAFGAVGGSSESDIYPRYSDGNAYYRVNSSGISGVTTASPIGHYLANRSSSSDVQGYKNGSSVLTNGSATSGAVANATFTFGAGIGGFAAVSPHQLASVSIGSSLSSTDATNFYNRLRTYMTAVGVP